MKQLKTFENWIDDETADTELDNFNEDDIENNLLDELKEEIMTLLDNYINKIGYNSDHIELLKRMFELE